MLGIVVGIISILVVIILLSSFILQIGIKANNLRDEELCRTTLWANIEAAVKIPAIGKFSPVKPDCKTISMVLPSDDKYNSYDGVMENIGYLSAQCWWMLGEGFYKGSQIDGFEYGGFKRPCHICYMFTIDEDSLTLENENGAEQTKPYISGADLYSSFKTNLYQVTPDWHESDCDNLIDDDGDNLVDKDDEDCANLEMHTELYTTNCGIRGGYCINKDLSCEKDGSPLTYYDLKEYDKAGWDCRRPDQDQTNEKCCVPSYVAPSFSQYIEDSDNYRGGLFLATDENNDFINLEPTTTNQIKEYAIAFVMPKNKINENYESTSDTTLYHILIEERSKIAQYCDVTDLSVRVG